MAPDQAEMSGSLSISHLASVVSLPIQVCKNQAMQEFSTALHTFRVFHSLVLCI